MKKIKVVKEKETSFSRYFSQVSTAKNLCMEKRDYTIIYGKVHRYDLSYLKTLTAYKMLLSNYFQIFYPVTFKKKINNQ